MSAFLLLTARQGLLPVLLEAKVWGTDLPRLFGIKHKKLLMSSAETGDRPVRGIVYYCVAIFLFTVMQAINKELAGVHTVVEIAFYRNVLSLIPCLLFVLLRADFSLLRTGMPRAMTGRVLIGTTGLFLTFAATQELPLANATVIFFTSTLILPVLARLILKEEMALHRWLAIAVGMSGVVLVAQPTPAMTLFGVLLAFGAAFFHAMIQVLLRVMRQENPFTITLYFFLGGAIVSGALMPFFAHRPTSDSALLLLGIGISGGLGQYFLTRAFQLASASLLSPFNYSGLLWALLLDVLLWHHFPSRTVLFGGLIIISSHFFLILRERARSRRLQKHLLAEPTTGV